MPQLVEPYYVDVERLLVSWLSQIITARLCTDLPSNLATVLPVVQVARVGGADDVTPIDRPLVDIDCYAAGRVAAYDLAQQVRDALRFELPGLTWSGAYVARVDTLSGPMWRPYDNTTLRRFGASYQLTTQKGVNP
jgi:hypothetical protein